MWRDSYYIRKLYIQISVLYSIHNVGEIKKKAKKIPSPKILKNVGIS